MRRRVGDVRVRGEGNADVVVGCVFGDGPSQLVGTRVKGEKVAGLDRTVSSRQFDVRVLPQPASVGEVPSQVVREIVPSSDKNRIQFSGREERRDSSERDLRV